MVCDTGRVMKNNDWTDQEIILFTRIKNHKAITAKMIRKAIKLLKKHKVEKPYYVEVENPKEGGDPLDGWKPVPKIIYKRDIKNI